jgi:hypothetical protein
MIVLNIQTSVADPDPFNTDPDLVFHFDRDPDPAFQFDPDPTVWYGPVPYRFKELMYLKQYFLYIFIPVNFVVLLE